MREEEKKKVKKLISAYKKQKREKEDYLEGWKRAKADLDNYKRKEKERLERFSLQDKKEFLRKFLPVLDNFKRAEEEASKAEEKGEVVEGLLKIKEQLEDILHREGLREIEALGREFNPEYHDAIEMVEYEGKESGIIVEEIGKGYLLGEEVVRPSKVKVNK